MADGSPVSFVFLVIFAILVFVATGGQILGLFSLSAVIGNFSGFTLFILKNMTVWIFCGIMISILLYFWRARK